VEFFKLREMAQQRLAQAAPQERAS
jgi:hypothetical protein